MATWEDGPEYAPLERPADFALPEVRPLEIAPRVQQQASLAPVDRPVFSDPPVPVAPLATLVPVAEDLRDPMLPFDVASATMTSDSAWGALHWSPPSGVAAAAPAGPPPPGSWPAPVQAPAGYPPVPAAPYPPTTAAPYPPTGDAAPSHPPPATPEWFGSPAQPGPGQPNAARPGRGHPNAGQPVTDQPVTAQRVFAAATPGMLICLVVGGIIPVVAPVLLGIALGLSSRVSVAKPQIRRAFTIAVSVVGLFAVIGALTNQTGFGDWWSFVGRWSLAACWVMVVASVVLVYRGLKSGSGPDEPSPRRATWG